MASRRNPSGRVLVIEDTDHAAAAFHAGVLRADQDVTMTLADWKAVARFADEIVALLESQEVSRG